MAKTKRPAKPRPIQVSDADIVQLMLDGLLTVENEFTSPIIRKHKRPGDEGRILTHELNEQGGRVRIHGGKRFRVTIWMNAKRRRIVVSRILWLWYFLAIPEGCELHHRNEVATDDRIGNLDCWTVDQHKTHHYGADDDSEF